MKGQHRITRREFLKGAGLTLLAGLAAGCSPTLSAQAEPVTVEPVSSSTPSPVSIPAPKATPSPTLLPAEPQQVPTVIIQPTQMPAPSTDVLTPEQKERLYRASLKYVAGTEREAISVARSMAYVKNDGHPASMCGPLSVAILRDAGLLNAYIDLHEFWLLDPRLHMPILTKVFPEDKFWWYDTPQSIAEFDFKAFPLKAGDWLYLYAGDRGSFEHMLTVSRVDEDGRAYGVSNYETEDGYFIGELMLYDPARPGYGQFSIWTDRKFTAIGLTGFGGFQLIRFSKPVPEPDAPAQALAGRIDQILADAGGDWKILIKAAGGQEIYSRRSYDRLHAASVIKMPVAILFFKALETRGVTDLSTALQKGRGGRSYEQLLRAMLVNSEEDATSLLLEEIAASNMNAQKTLDAWGVHNVDLTERRTTTAELVLLAEKLYQGELLQTDATRMLLGLLEAYTPNDDTRLGVLRKILPQGSHFYNKRGTITEGLLVVADLAVISLPANPLENAYIMGVFAFQGEPTTTYERLNAAVAQVAQAFGDYLESELP